MLSRSKTIQQKRKQQRRIWLRRISVLCMVLFGGLWIWMWWQSDFEPRPATQVNLADDNDHPNKEDQLNHENESADEIGIENPTLTEEQDETDNARIHLAFVGDIMFSGNVERLLLDQGFDYPYVYVKEYLQQADLTIANLETPISTRGEPEDKTFVYRSPPEALPSLVDSGVDIVNLANNHILDYGLTGMLDTFEHLNQAGLQYIGAGRNADEAYSPVIVEKNDITIAFFGFSQVVPEVWWKADVNHPGVAETYDHTRPVQAIESVRDEVDLVVVVAHWGIEREAIPTDRQMDMAHRYIDAGADLVIGGHPHVLQSIEYYQGKWIAYSLGNFIFTTNDHPETWETVILQATCSKQKECELQFIPILTKWAQPKPMDPAAATALFERLSEISINTVIEQDGKARQMVTQE